MKLSFTDMIFYGIYPEFMQFDPRFRPEAQMDVQCATNAQVAGSTPARATISVRITWPILSQSGVMIYTRH